MALAVPEARVTGLPETPAGGIAPEAAELLCERAKRNDAVLLGPGMMDKDAVAGLTTGMVKGLVRAGARPGCRGAGLPGYAAGAPVRAARDGRSSRPMPARWRACWRSSATPWKTTLLPSRVRSPRRFQMVVALKGGTTHIVGPRWRVLVLRKRQCRAGDIRLRAIPWPGSWQGWWRAVPARRRRRYGVSTCTVRLATGLRAAVAPWGSWRAELLAEIPGIMAELAHRRGGAEEEQGLHTASLRRTARSPINAACPQPCGVHCHVPHSRSLAHRAHRARSPGGVLLRRGGRSCRVGIHLRDRGGWQLADRGDLPRRAGPAVADLAGGGAGRGGRDSRAGNHIRAGPAARLADQVLSEFPADPRRPLLHPRLPFRGQGAGVLDRAAGGCRDGVRVRRACDDLRLPRGARPAFQAFSGPPGARHGLRLWASWRSPSPSSGMFRWWHPISTPNRCGWRG